MVGDATLPRLDRSSGWEGRKRRPGAKLDRAILRDALPALVDERVIARARPSAVRVVHALVTWRMAVEALTAGERGAASARDLGPWAAIDTLPAPHAGSRLRWPGVGHPGPIGSVAGLMLHARALCRADAARRAIAAGSAVRVDPAVSHRGAHVRQTRWAAEVRGAAEARLAGVAVAVLEALVVAAIEEGRAPERAAPAVGAHRAVRILEAPVERAEPAPGVGSAVRGRRPRRTLQRATGGCRVMIQGDATGIRFAPGPGLFARVAVCRHVTVVRLGGRRLPGPAARGEHDQRRREPKPHAARGST